MSSRMVKWLILASVLLIAFPVVAGASTSRIAGMGVQGDYIKDYTNIFGYPSCVPNVGNLVYGEFGVVTAVDENYSEYFQTEDRAVGAVLGNLFGGKYGTFGIHMREYSPALGTGFQPYLQHNGELDEYLFGTGFETFYGNGLDYGQYLDPNVPGSTGYTPYFNGYGVEAFDLMWGKKFNAMSLGLRLNRSAYKVTEDLAATTVDPAATSSQEGYAPDDRDVLGFGVGFGYEHSPTLQSELGFLYQSRTFKWENDGGDVFENDGGGAYLFSGRMMWQWQPNVLVVPVVRYYSFDMSTAITNFGDTTGVDEMKQSGWQAGVAGNWTLNQNDLFVLGVTFASNTWEENGIPADPNDDMKWTESLMPTLFASLETKVNSWLTLRFGGRKGVFYSIKLEEKVVGETSTEFVAYERKVSGSPFQFFTGAGVKLGTLQFDATLAQDFFHNPATYVTGSPNGYFSPLFPKVTATYTF